MYTQENDIRLNERGKGKERKEMNRRRVDGKREKKREHLHE